MKRMCLTLFLLVLFSAASVHGYVYSGSKWPANTMTYAVNLDSCLATGLSGGDVLNDLQLAAGAWTVQTNANVALVYGGTTSITTRARDGVSAVFCDATASPDGYLAFTQMFTDWSGALAETDIEFWLGAASYTTGFTTSNQVCVGSEAILLDLATHEFGHAIGLLHSDVADATMHIGLGPCDTRDRSLEPDDILAAETVYGLRLAPPPPPGACVPDTMITETLNNGLVDAWLTQKYAEGYGLVSRTKNKSQTTVVVACMATALMMIN